MKENRWEVLICKQEAHLLYPGLWDRHLVTANEVTARKVFAEVALARGERVFLRRNWDELANRFQK